MPLRDNVTENNLSIISKGSSKPLRGRFKIHFSKQEQQLSEHIMSVTHILS
jgi:hypothetical protein